MRWSRRAAAIKKGYDVQEMGQQRVVLLEREGFVQLRTRHVDIPIVLPWRCCILFTKGLQIPIPEASRVKPTLGGDTNYVIKVKFWLESYHTTTVIRHAPAT